MILGKNWTRTTRCHKVMMIVLREKSERQMEEEGLRMLCKEGHRKSARLDNTLIIIIIIVIITIVTINIVVIIMFCKRGPSKTARLENTLALAIIIVLINM